MNPKAFEVMSVCQYEYYIKSSFRVIVSYSCCFSSQYMFLCDARTLYFITKIVNSFIHVQVIYRRYKGP